MFAELDGSCDYPILEKYQQDPAMVCRLESLKARCNKIDDCYVYCVGNDVGEAIGGGCGHLCNYRHLEAWNPPGSIKDCPEYPKSID